MPDSRRPALLQYRGAGGRGWSREPRSAEPKKIGVRSPGHAAARV